MTKKRTVAHRRAVSKAKRIDTPTKPIDERVEPGTPSAIPASAPATFFPGPQSVLRTGSLVRPIRRGGAGLNTDYRYVVADLKRIALLAAGTFAVLVGLTFVIR